MGWFTAECIVRFLVSKNKCDFVRKPLNIIDLLAITPYYISVLMSFFTGENSQLQRAGVTLRVLRMMRIFWVIKLARHFIGLQTLGLTLKRCYREMVMLLVFICVAMAIFGALAQLLESGLDLEDKNPAYASIPASCWWVIISMTTVGYGDMYPFTIPGRILGGMCVVSGIVLLALPITFIYHSFVHCYHELKFRATVDAISLVLHSSLEHLDNKDNYVRLLLIEGGAVGNIIIPSRLISKLRNLGLGSALCNWILSFLTQTTISDDRKKIRKKLWKVVCTAQTITEANLPSMDSIYNAHCCGKADNTIKDPSHPYNDLLQPLLSGRRYRSLNIRTSRFRNSFFPALKVMEDVVNTVIKWYLIHRNNLLTNVLFGFARTRKDRVMVSQGIKRNG
eukprot:g47482.t1